MPLFDFRFLAPCWIVAAWLMWSVPTSVLAQAVATSTPADADDGANEVPPAPEKPSYYYFDPDGLGAHAFYNPQNFIVQGGLGALYAERIDSFDWANGFRIVNRSLLHPVRTVENNGTERFFYREFVPHIGPGQNYVPNWLWHFFGGGMRTKLMEEYYLHHGFERRSAKALSWLTLYSYHYLNEAVQAARFSHNSRYTVDPLADMYFFDWAGGLLYQFDAVNRFMSGTLHQREWSYQAQYNPVTQRLFNNGQLYWLRLEVFSPLSLSLLTGEQISSLNVTYEWREGRQLSAGVGPQTKGFIAKKNGDTDPSEIVFNFGVYYSVRDNPIATFTYEPKGRNEDAEDRRRYAFTGKCILNLYPSVARVFAEPIGLTLAYHEDAVFLGATWGPLPAGLITSTPSLRNGEY